MNIKQILSKEDQLIQQNELLKTNNIKEIKNIYGWTRTVRSSSNTLAFCVINDGSNVSGMQIVLNNENMEENQIEHFLKNIQIGTFLNCSGYIIESPAEGQKYEMLLKTYEIVGAVDEKYPFSKGRINLDTLRNFYHLRGRTNTFGSVFRIRSALMKYTSDFFYNKDFLHLDPNIITINECEGAGDTFKLSDKDLNTIYKQFHKEKDESMTYKWNEDHFKRATYLTVSSQLQLEALTCCLGNCYTMNKSFRAEHSNTRKHLSEFTHLEIEMINNDFTDLMHIGEEYIKYVIEQLLKYNNDDLENLDKFTSKGLLEKINNIRSKSFITIEYKDVINEINQDIKENGSELELEALTYGDDLGSKHEDYITKKYDNGVFVTKWPMELKSFYMKQDASNDTCYSFDLLMPYGIGELIGGSQREEDYDKLNNMMDKKGMNKENLKFYTDLRKYGTCMHGGFGLGFERLCMLLTGMQNIRDVVPFPVYYESCSF